MALPRFFKPPSHYVFDYKPLYYDPRKEEREKKEKEYKKELGIEETEEEYKPDIKGQFKSRIHYKRHVRQTSNLRLILLLVFIGVVAYMFFYTDVVSIISASFAQ